jgi:CDP-diacylglycerol--glycerol-3-phosphate 3-phosphatidyltransferase
MEPYIRSRAGFIVDPIVKLLIWLKFTPDSLTITGFLLNCVAGLLIAMGWPATGGFVMTALAMPLDGLDGPLARATGKQGKWGAFLDSTLDRYAEAAILLGTAWYFLQRGDSWSVLGAFLALLGSLMVSYSRAKAESLGLHGEVGLFPIALVIMVWLLAVLSNLTAIQRMMYVARNT